VNESTRFHGFESLSVLKSTNLDTDEYRAAVRAVADMAGSSMADIAAAWLATQRRTAQRPHCGSCRPGRTYVTVTERTPARLPTGTYGVALREPSDVGYETLQEPEWVLELDGEYIATLDLPPYPTGIAAVRLVAGDALGYAVDAVPIGGCICGATRPVVDAATTSPDWILTQATP
jgi:hypothetical protein